MMTAEQFHKQWDVSQINSPGKYYWYNMAEAYAAAQLAEKERELERSRGRNARLVSMFDSAQLRVEAAEQRLQEAQEAIRINSNSAEAEFPEGVWEESCGTIHIGIRILAERLRQREAKLEQLRAQISAERGAS